MRFKEQVLQFDMTEIENVVILSIRGTVKSASELAQFREKVKQLIESGLTSVVVDFSRMRWFGSAMLGVLIASLTLLRNAGGDLRLTGITKQIEKILTVTHLTRIFRTLESVDQAVESYSQ